MRCYTALVAILAVLALTGVCAAEVDAQDDMQDAIVARGQDVGEPTYYQRPHIVRPPALSCATAENCPYVQLQNELLSGLLFQSIDQSRRLAALEDYVFGSQPVPFNKAECLARGEFNTTFAPNATSQWVVLNFDTSNVDATKICRGQYGQAPTCSAVCGARGLRCDACGMMQTSCPSQLWQALGWAGADRAVLKLYEDTYFFNAAGPPFADPYGCPSSATTTAGGPFVAPTTPANAAYAKSLGNARALCDLGTKPAIVTNFYPAMKNMVDPLQNATYIDPNSACNAPIWDTFTQAGQPSWVQYSALCYCNGALPV